MTSSGDRKGGRSAPARRVTVLAAGLVVGASFLVVLAAGGFGPARTTTPGPVGGASLGPAISGSPVPADGRAATPASPVTGVLTDIEATGLTTVTAITLRTADGVQTTFRIGVLENGAEFPPGHLTEHMATSSPVRVYFRDEDGTPVVYRIEDAE